MIPYLILTHPNHALSDILVSFVGTVSDDAIESGHSVLHSAIVIEKMILWAPTVIALLGFCTPRVLTDTIRGVNLGGWLLVEEWYVETSGQHKSTPMLTRQDNAFSIPQYRYRRRVESVQLFGQRTMSEKARKPLAVRIICQSFSTNTLLTPVTALSSAAMTSRT